MNKPLYFFSILLISISARCQTIEKNLKLVGFKSIDSSYTGNRFDIYYETTVPVNKIWKLQDVYCLCNFYVNDVLIYRNPSGNTSYPALAIQNMWLKAGDIIGFNPFGSSGIYYLNLKLSVFEYVLE